MKFFYINRIIFCVIALSAGLTSCIGNGLNSVPDQREFWVIDMTPPINYDTDEAAWYQVTGNKLVETDNCAVFGDSSKSISVSDAETIAGQFESTIHPLVTENFADSLDVDSNGKIFILLTDIIDNYKINGIYTGGYFHQIDFYSEATIDRLNSTSNKCLKTNQCEVIYIDINPHPYTTVEGWRTIAHEFQHMVNASYRLSQNCNSLDTWINEGLAESSSHLCYGQQSGRITYYNDYPTQFRDGHPLFYWDASNSIPNYTLSYLYFQYLCAQSSGEEGIFRNIITASAGDYNAVINAIGRDAKLLAHGANASQAFDRLLLRFYATNAGVTGSKYGYGSRITGLDAPGEVSGDTSLSSGGGIYNRNISSSYSDTSPTTEFLYLATNGTTEDFDPSNGVSTTSYFIAVNRKYTPKSGDTTGTDFPASVNSSVSSISTTAESSGRSGTGGSSPHMIDFVPHHMPMGSLPMPEGE